MRAILIILGAILLIVGGIFYFMPVQSAAATTTTVNGDDVASRTSYGSVAIPWPATLAILLTGLALFLMGLLIPDAVVHTRRVHDIDDDSDYNVRTTEEIDLDTGRKRTTIRDHHVHRSPRRL